MTEILLFRDPGVTHDKQGVGIKRDFVSLATQDVEGAMARDCKHPGNRSATFGAVLRSSLPYAHEGLLQGFLGKVSALEDTHEQPE